MTVSARFQLSAYWWCQLLGWGLVGIYWYYYSLNSYSWSVAIIICALQVGFKILFTHAYYLLAHRRGWTRRSLVQLLPVTMIGWVALVSLYNLESYLVYSLRWGPGGYFENDVYLGALTGGVRYMAIWLLAFHGYHFARRSAAQAARAARNGQLATEARMAKLTGDLNPHFLFNALNGIRALTREDPARSRDAIDQLSALLRYSLTRSSQPLVPLAEEVMIIREYLALEKIRLEERLMVNWDLPDDHALCAIPPLSLHTLVDNAVKHGIARLPTGGTITIGLQKTGDAWEFSVSNPCSSIPNSGACDPAPESAGTGIENLRQRLQLQYGNDAHLRFLRTETFATANLSIPL